MTDEKNARSAVDAFWTIMDYVEKYNGAINAVGTVVIAIFTIVLAKVSGKTAALTQISAEAARDAANVARQSLTDLERPYIYILCEGQFDYDASTGHLFVEYDVVNHGKSAAIIEDFDCQPCTQ
jgi:hypothetical protein